MCKSSAEGGRCATFTRNQLTKSHAQHFEAVMEAHNAEMGVSARVDELTAEMGLGDFTQLPEHVYDTDSQLSSLCETMRDKDELQRVARRGMDAAYVDHAGTPSGHEEIMAQAVAAKQEGRAQSAAYLLSLLNQADDIKTARARYAARQPQHA